MDLKNKAGVEYDNFYKFIAADAKISLMGVFLGGGIRREYWPAGKDGDGQKVGAPTPKIFPALIAGLGFM